MEYYAAPLVALLEQSSRNPMLGGSLSPNRFSLLWCLWFLASVAGNAAPLDFAPTGPRATLDSAPRFLRVEEAYRLNVAIEGERLVLSWAIAPGYYLYRDQFKFSAQGPDGAAIAVAPAFATGRRAYDAYYQKELEVYYGATQILLPFAKPPATVALTLVSQGCADAGLCYPPRTQVAHADFRAGVVTVTEGGPVPTTGNGAAGTPPPPATAPASLPLLLLFAMLGGVLLNLMPCVFPVLSIKVLSVAAAHPGARQRHRHGYAYALGIVASCVLIAALLALLRGAGAAVGWGFHLQSPVFIAFLAYLLFVVAQSFAGEFEFGARLMNLGQATTVGGGLGASFATGILTTVVASPCTAPFMGTALGAALTLPPAIGGLIFAALGVGMALPFLLLTWFPALLKRLPAPGSWMVRLRALLAFPLYLSVIWLLWVLGRQAGIDQATIVAIGLLLIAFAIWLARFARGRVAKALVLAAVLTAVALPFMPTDGSPAWEPYTPARLAELRAQGAPVLVNLTADWCITCLVNERIALNSDRFRQALRAQGATYLKGDWTRYDPDITALLTQYGRNGVPLYLLYPAGGGDAQILPQVLTEASVISALESANIAKRPAN